MTQKKTFGARSTADHVLAGIDLTGKHILVSGCDSGIGFETAGALAANGAHVIAAAPTLHEARRACDAIGYHCSPLECDLRDLDSVAAAAATVRRLEVLLDSIVATAGAAHVAPAPAAGAGTRYGVEEHFLVNHLAHFALLNDLAGVVREAVGRIVIVTSRAAGAGGVANGIMFDNLAGERGQPAASYAQSMFANALYAKELSRRLQVRGITVNAVNPGQVRGMGLGKPLGLVRRLAQIAALPFQRTPAQGAATIALLAASPDAAGITGEYWQDCAIAPGNPLLDDAAMSVRLWETSEAILAVHASRSQRLARAA